MTRREIHFNNVLRSRGVSVLLAAAGVWLASHALSAGKVPRPVSGLSVTLPSPAEWFSPGSDLSFWVNVVAVGLTAFSMLLINRRYNLLRTISIFFAGFFVFTTMCTPVVGAQFTGATLLALVVMSCVHLMFSVYARRAANRRVFLVFTLLTAGALCNYAFLFYLPVFFAGLGQMRIFSFKRVLAAVIGIVTPVWIVYGILPLPVPRMPEIYFTPPTELLSVPGGIPFVVTVAFTIGVWIILSILNLLKVLSFNTRGRAYFGLLTLTFLCTAVCAAVNFTNLGFYTVLLNTLTAFQTGLFFRSMEKRRAYIVILILIASYGALYYWQLTTI